MIASLWNLTGKFQSYWTILNTNLAVPRLCEILQKRLSGYWNRTQQPVGMYPPNCCSGHCYLCCTRYIKYHESNSKKKARDNTNNARCWMIKSAPRSVIYQRYKSANRYTQCFPRFMHTVHTSFCLTHWPLADGRFVSGHSVCQRFGVWDPGFESCSQQWKTSCLLSIRISLACARASKLTTTNIYNQIIFLEAYLAFFVKLYLDGCQ